MTKFLLIIMGIFFISTVSIRDTKAEVLNNSEVTLNFYFNYRDMGEFESGLAPIKDEKGKLGYVGLDGEIAIDYQFDIERLDFDLDGVFELSSVYENRSVTGENWTVFDRMLDPRISHAYLPSSNFGFDRGYAYVRKDSRNFFIDTAGKEVENPFPEMYSFVAPYYNGLALAKRTDDGLFGYIDEAGNEVIPFKYMCASHFKDGVALAIEAVPFKNGKSRYYAPGIESSPDFHRIDDIMPTRAKNLPKGMDIIDVFLDTGGNVLSWNFHEKDQPEPDFRSGEILLLDELSEGLLLKYSMSTDGGKNFWYVLPDGSVAVTPDEALDIIYAFPFSPERIAEIQYNVEGELKTGYIDNTGKLLDITMIEEKFPNMLKDIVYVILDENLMGPTHKIIRSDGVDYLKINNAFSNWSAEKLSVYYFVVSSEGVIISDCTEQMLDGLSQISANYWNIPIETAKSDIMSPLSTGISVEKSAKNSNIFYVRVRTSIRETEYMGFFTIEGW